MSLFVLKCIAVIAMLIDHIGLLFFPHLLVLRLIGRLAFPIFAWTIANGYHYTKSKRAYLLRLILFAIISQIPYVLIYTGILHTTSYVLNIFFTLAFGLGVIMLYEKYSHTFVGGVVCIAAFLVGSVLPFEYGAYGIIMIVLFHLTITQPKEIFVTQICWTLFAIYMHEYVGTAFFGYVGDLFVASTKYQLGIIGALPLIYMYNNTLGPKKYTWWFYGFYPIHLMVLWSVYMVL